MIENSISALPRLSLAILLLISLVACDTFRTYNLREADSPVPTADQGSRAPGKKSLKSNVEITAGLGAFNGAYAFFFQIRNLDRTPITLDHRQISAYANVNLKRIPVGGFEMRIPSFPHNETVVPLGDRPMMIAGLGESAVIRGYMGTSKFAGHHLFNPSKELKSITIQFPIQRAGKKIVEEVEFESHY